MSGPLHVVDEPDEMAVLEKYEEVQRRHGLVMQDAWIGALVRHFTNDELRVLADRLVARLTEIHQEIDALGFLHPQNRPLGGRL